MTEAQKFYNELIDLDFWDYTETYENDIMFIQSIINEYGVNDARKILQSYFE